MTLETAFEITALAVLGLLTLLPFLLICLNFLLKEKLDVYTDKRYYRRKLRVVRGGKLDKEGDKK